ncbi:MAG: acyltransferase family protein [Roseburia sp.]
MPAKNTNIRQSNLELLRIVAVLIIILSHYVGHGGFDYANQGFSINRLFVETFRLGAVGVDVFILISGYFLVSAGFSPSKFLRLECEILFYSTLLGIVFFLTTDTVGLKGLIFSFLPSLSNSYWFISTYLLLYLLSPFLNRMIHALGKKQHGRLLVILYTIYVLIPTVTNLTLGGTSNIMLFVTLYLTAAYCRLYQFLLGERTAANFVLAALSLLVISASTIAFDFLNTRLGITRYDASYFTSAYSLPIVLCSLGLFLGFRNLKLNWHPSINWIAGSSLGIYLLHDNNFMRSFLWRDLLDCTAYQESPFLILHALLCVLLVFVVCLFLDKLRFYLLERPIFRFWSGKLQALDNYFKTEWKETL